ncbi:MAG: 50S ribosomal protein L11 methyltransferase [Thiohalocapsa sp.]
MTDDMRLTENPRIEILFPPGDSRPWYCDIVSHEAIEPYQGGDSAVCLSLRKASQDPAAIEPEYAERLRQLVGKAVYIPASRAQAVQYPLDLYYSMLVNTDRMLPYLMALAKVARPGTTVFEIGSGLSIFAMAAAKLGARVMALEPGVSGDIAERTARENGLEIEFVRKLIDDYEPAEKADVVVSEFIGDAIFDEGFVDISQIIRRRYLKEGGRMIPYALDACVVGVEDDDLRNTIDRQRSQIRHVGRSVGLDLGSYCDSVSYNHQTHVICSDYRDNIWDRREKAVTVTGEGTLSSVLLGVDETLQTGGSVDLEIVNEGFVDAFFVYFRAYLDEEITITNALDSMPLFSWPEIWIPAVGTRKRYRPGDTLTVDWAYRVFGVRRYALRAGGLPKIVLKARQ